MKIGDIVKLVPDNEQRDKDLSGIIVDIKADKAQVIWELTNNIHTPGMVRLDRLIKHPNF